MENFALLLLLESLRRARDRAEFPFCDGGGCNRGVGEGRETAIWSQKHAVFAEAPDRFRALVDDRLNRLYTRIFRINDADSQADSVGDLFQVIEVSCPRGTELQQYCPNIEPLKKREQRPIAPA